MSQKKYDSKWIIKKILHKVHYTMEATLKLVITWIKLPEVMLILTIYIPFYIMV